MDRSRVQRRRQVIGVMTGTSMDGADAARVTFEGYGLELTAHLEAHDFVPMGPLASRLREVSMGASQSAQQWSQMSDDLAVVCSQAIERVVDGQCRPDLIAVHGQTLFHAPPLSLQLLNAAPIAQQFGVPVIYNFRQADLAAGGQGAPITPLADWVFFKDAVQARAIVNLGGFANATLLPEAQGRVGPAEIGGFDCCSCNQLLDALARTLLDCAYDEDGRVALQGEVDQAALGSAVHVLSQQRRQRRSLGTGDELPADLVDTFKGLTPDNALATATAAVAKTIAASLHDGSHNHSATEVLVAGGGARNAALVKALDRELEQPVRLTNAVGMPIEAREAAAMATLGLLSSDGIAITLPQITGCTSPAPLAGVWCSPTPS